MQDLSIYNRELWAYTSVFKQLSAKYNDTLLQDYGKQLDDDYEAAINARSFTEIKTVIDRLNLLILNLTILIIRKGYKDIEPICSYMRDIIVKVQSEVYSQKTNN